MAPVTVWLPLLFLVLMPKQSNEVSAQYSDREFQNLDVRTYNQRIGDPKSKEETVYTECREQVENENRILAAAFSVLTLMEDEIKIYVLQELRVVKEQLQAIIDWQRKTEEANNRTSQELREVKEQLQETMFGHTKIMELLNTPFDTGCRRLLDAAKSGDVNSAKFWVKFGNDSCVARDYYSSTAVIVAAEYGHVEVVRVLLEGGANIEGTAGFGWNALMVAAANGKLDVCRLLLDRGAKVNAVSNYGYTALLFAAWNGHLSVVKLLVERGADVTVKDKEGKTAIEVARSRGRKVVVKWLGSVSQG